MKRFKVSIIIPTFNAENFIGRTLKSVFNQTFPDFEIIVVDDASTDKTLEVVCSLCTGHSNVTLISRDRNSNLPAVPRNLGARQSSGELLAFLDHDDVWSRDKLSRHVWAMNDKPDLAVTHSILWQFRGKNLLPGLQHFPTPRSRETTRPNLLADNLVQFSSAVVRRDAFSAVGGFDENPALRAVEDYDLWLRLSERYAFGFIPEILGYYRIHRQGTSDQGLATEYDNLMSVRKIELGVQPTTIWSRVRKRLRYMHVRLPEALIGGSIRRLFRLPPKTIEGRPKYPQSP